jgi:hypothetical protein
MFSETRYALNGDLRVAYRASREGLAPLASCRQRLRLEPPDFHAPGFLCSLRSLLNPAGRRITNNLCLVALFWIDPTAVVGRGAPCEEGRSPNATEPPARVVVGIGLIAHGLAFQ